MVVISMKKNIKYYIITFIIGFILILYLFYKDPGLFPFSILLDGILAFIINVVISAISYMLAYAISLIMKEKKEKVELISFIVIYVILCLIYIGKRFI